jgi:tetratricopeptide (TPR) repeat protein
VHTTGKLILLSVSMAAAMAAQTGPGSGPTIRVMDRIIEADKLARKGQPSEIEAAYKAVVETCKANGCTPEENAIVLNNLGAWYVKSARYREAEPLLDEAVARFRKAKRQSQLSSSLINYAMVKRQMAKPNDAEAALLESLSIREQMFPASPETAAVLVSLGAFYQEVGNFPKSSEAAERGLAMYAKGLLKEDSYRATLLDLRGMCLRQQQQFIEAEKAYREALSIRERLTPDNPGLMASSFNNVGSVLIDQMQFNQALEWLNRSLDKRIEAHGPNHASLLSTYTNLSVCHNELGNLEQAKLASQRALEIASSSISPGHPLLGTIHNNLAEVYLRMGAFEKAEPEFRAAIDILEKSAPDSPTLATCLANLANLFVRQGKHNGAEKLLMRALETHTRVHSPNDPAYKRLGKALAAVYRLQRRNTEADRLERNSFRFTPGDRP